MLHAMHIVIALVMAQHVHGHYLSETNTEYHLRNEHLEAHISKKTGNISALIVRGKNLLSHESTAKLSNRLKEIPVGIARTEHVDNYPEYARVQLTSERGEITLTYRFTIDSSALRWEVEALGNESDTKEVTIDFDIPVVRSMDRLFYPALDTPLEIEENIKRRLIYRRNVFIPAVSVYNSKKNHGLTFVAPFEIPKPGLSFSVDDKTITVSYFHLRLSKKQGFTVGIYLNPHEGDWRSGLAFMLNRYPTYFLPVAEKTKHGEGWYVQGRVHDSEAKIQGAAEQSAGWSELHYHFPFYGLYVPERHDWALISNSDQVSLSEWEEGAGDQRNSKKKMENLIDLWHKHGIQVYPYFQCFESWHQYAEKYYANDIARKENGEPHSAWKFCNLMNPDMSNKWGMHIIKQAHDLINAYPEADGIFYDRMDYWKYDFAHDDGLTMIHDRPAYMLAFAQEKINKKIFSLFHENDKGVWGNIPTSIEVCENLDGIMSEANLRLLKKLQYLGMVRPLIYLAHDAAPIETENKLKNALVCGAYPSITYGDRTCKKLDSKYRPMFDIMYNRKWVLTPHALIIPTQLKGNIFETPEGNYVAYITNPGKSQLVPHPFEYNHSITINVPYVHEIKNVYLLSGDWAGINAVAFNKTTNAIDITLPCHLAASALYLTKSSEYDIVRLTKPVLTKGTNEAIAFRVLNSGKSDDLAFTLELPWCRETKTPTAEIVTFHTRIPDTIDGEIRAMLRYDNKEHTMSWWVLDPVSISPKERIFTKFMYGDSIPFYITNNTNSTINVEIKAIFTKGHGTITAPKKIALQPFQDKTTKFFIAPADTGELQVAVKIGSTRIIKKFTVESALPFSADDLFHDDFSHGLNNWKLEKGKWRSADGFVQGSGHAHAAFVYNSWKNLVYEVRTRIYGSSDASVDWLKSYLFFRVQDSRNLYRFGIHGDVGVVDLYKSVDGKWTQLGSSMFEPKKNTWYVLKVEITGPKIKCYVDGQQVIATTDHTFLSGGIGIGVLEDGMICDYKDVVVKDL